VKAYRRGAGSGSAGADIIDIIDTPRLNAGTLAQAAQNTRLSRICDGDRVFRHP